jgi:acyl-CoA synthetase (AMP-forming)/AMP-acid ligase II
MGVQDFTFYNVIRRNAICFRNRCAWFEAADQRSVTYGQYKDMVDRAASGLQALGVVKGDRVGIIGKNGLEYFIVYGAAAALGAIVLPINWRLSPGEIVFNLNDCIPKIVFADREYENLIFEHMEKMSYVEKFFNLDQEKGKFRDFRQLMNNEAQYNHQEVESDDGFVIIHTAAVGGRPKGALLSHSNLLSTDINLGYS